MQGNLAPGADLDLRERWQKAELDPEHRHHRVPSASELGKRLEQVENHGRPGENHGKPSKKVEKQ